MMRSMIVGWTRLRSLLEFPLLPLCAGMVCLDMVMMLWFGGTPAFAQGRFTEVLVSVVKNKVVAVNGVEPSEIDLGVGETVVSTKALGLTGLAITSTRLWTSMSISHRSFENYAWWRRSGASMGFRKLSRIGRPKT